jgi:phospholipase C
VTQANPGQGGELMGFFNMNHGDAPVFKQLAQNWAISDNYHQYIMGGTGANFFALATGDAAVYKLSGALATPPANQIENPNPKAGSVNFYSNDGYSGGSYVNCADATQPGVAAILAVLNAKGRASNCESGAYYLVNNYEPPYEVDGTAKTLGATAYIYPPQTVPTIGELLTAHNVTWGWYTGGREDADVTSEPIYQTVVYPQVFAKVKAQFPAGTPDSTIAAVAQPIAIKTARPIFYNTIGDPHNASANVVGNPGLKANLKGLTSFYADVTAGSLPEVSYVVPKNLASGHPGYSAPYAYEAFLSDLIGKIQASEQWRDTAIVITTDEGGGYFDTGFIQNLDFFGDGPRIPLVVVSPFAKRGYIDHSYHDHASILKFIEANWGLPRLSQRSRDNLPNPVTSPYNPYRPTNQPAVGDLMSLFKFPAPRHFWRFREYP